MVTHRCILLFYVVHESSCPTSGPRGQEDGRDLVPLEDRRGLHSQRFLDSGKVCVPRQDP